MIESVWNNLSACWRRLVAAELVANLIAGILLVPLLSALFQLFLWTSGRDVLLNHDIAQFMLHPLGIVTLLAMTAGGLCIWGVKFATLVLISLGHHNRLRPSVSTAYAHVTSRILDVLQVAFRATRTLLILAAPFLLVGGAIYWALLTKRDINYYLTDRPIEFWVAGSLMVVLLTGMLAVLFWTVCHWVYALPMLLFENTPPEHCLAVSRRRCSGSVRPIVYALLQWAAAVLVLRTIISVPIIALADLFVSHASQSLGGLIFFGGGAMLLVSLLNFSLSVVSSITLASLVSTLYVQDRAPQRIKVPVLQSRAFYTPNWEITPVRRAGLIFGCLIVPLLLSGWTIDGLAFDDARLDQVRITAHRGGASSAPENTLAAIQQAIEDGADRIEIDVQESRDGVVMVVHDSDLMRVANEPRKIWQSSREELQAVDLGRKFSPTFAGSRVPTLIEVLDLCKKYPPVEVNIELKYYGHAEALETRVARCIQITDMASRVRIMSLDADGMQRMRAALLDHPDFPPIPLGLLSGAKVGDLQRLGSQFDFFAVSRAAATRSFIQACHSPRRTAPTTGDANSGSPGQPVPSPKRTEVAAWTLNDPASLALMISRGVDDLITDDPALARKILDDYRELSNLERLALGISLRLGIGYEPRTPDEELEAAPASNLDNNADDGGQATTASISKPSAGS